MIKILITGAHSYIGTAFENYLQQWPEDYQVHVLDLQRDAWRETCFEGYNALLHVAGITHRRESKKNAELYYSVNRDLAAETAAIARKAGVEQFIFLSSISVYGMDTGVITQNTPLCPRTHYGQSKYEAEEKLRQLADRRFTVTILRSPMVYGKNCSGNFQTMIKLVKKYRVFPKVHNSRSMIYIDNLCAMTKALIDSRAGGVFFPRNADDINTSDMAKWMAEALNRPLFLSRILGAAAFISMRFSRTARKAFGSLTYQGVLPIPCEKLIGNRESIHKSVK